MVILTYSIIDYIINSITQLNFLQMNQLPKKQILPKITVNKRFQTTENDGPTVTLSKNIQNLISHIKQMVDEQKRTNEEQKKINQRQQRINKAFSVKIMNSRMQARLQNIDYPILENISFEQKVRSQQIVNWVGNMFKEVLSIGFNLFKNEIIEENKYKAFCSQNIIRNLINFSKVHKITQEQIQLVDKCIVEEFAPYFKLKYPETEEQSVNREFESMLILRDSISENEFDMVHKSGVKFSFKADGNYNSEIMSFLNYIIGLPSTQVEEVNIFNKKYKCKAEKDSKIITNKKEKQELKIQKEKAKSNKTTLKRSFFAEAQTFFKKIESQSQLIEMQKFHPKNADKTQTKQSDKKVRQVQENCEEKEKEKYREKVQSYTSYLIGQKLGDGNAPFSEYDIKSGTFKLNSSAMMRVLTKWCEELEDCFNGKSILQRETPFRMENAENRYYSLLEVKYLDFLLQQEKVQIDYKILQIKKNNYFHQSNCLNSETLPQLLKFSEDEAMVGQFSSFQFKNNQGYLLMYINLLIHGIKRACRSFSDYFTCAKKGQVNVENQSWFGNILRETQTIFQNQPEERSNLVSLTPELITFRIGDLLRCKCSSKENEIIALYKQIERVSKFHPQHFKIIRVKNRLSSGNKDILMNILYKETMVVEMQLAIKQQKSRFIEYSNKFNHYLYEMKRAKFGAIMEMCSMWMSQDSRASHYKNVSQLPRHAQIENQQNQQNWQKLKCCQQYREQYALLPFVCGRCKHHYFDFNIKNQHSVCTNCKNFTCFTCKFSQTRNQDQKLNQRPEFKQLLSADENEIKFVNDIPNQGGVLFNLNSKTSSLIFFSTIQRNNKSYLFQIGDQVKKPIHQFKLKQLPQNFFKENLICTSEHIVQKIDKTKISALANNYFIQKYLDDGMKSEKASIYLPGSQVTKQIMSQNSNKTWTHVKKMNLSENHLQNIGDCVTMFPHLQMALLSNQFVILDKTGLSEVPKMIWPKIQILHLRGNAISQIGAIYDCLQLTELDLSQNCIREVSERVGKLTKTRKLWLNDNKISRIADEFQNLYELTLLNISNNKQLVKLPQAFTNMKQLQILQFQNIGVQQLPEGFMKNKNKIKSLKANKLENLKNISQQISDMTQLQVLQIQNTLIQKLPTNLDKLLTLKQLVLDSNKSLKQLPQSLGNLTLIEQLKIKQCPVQSLPKSFGNLTCLNQLMISECLLSVLPQSFGNLSALKKLSIDNLQRLTQLPQSFTKLSVLIDLELQSCQLLNCLPESFNNLYSLQNLNITNCSALKQLPESFGCLPKLKKLTINDNNKLASLPDSLGNLCTLRELKIQRNQMLSFLPNSFGNLRNIGSLAIIQNKTLTSLPHLFGYLSSLKYLKIQRNKMLTSLPDSFGNLRFMVELSINENAFTRLPQSFGNLSALKKLRMCNSPNMSNLPQSFKNLSLQRLTVTNTDRIYKCIPKHMSRIVFLFQ